MAAKTLGIQGNASPNAESVHCHKSNRVGRFRLVYQHLQASDIKGPKVLSTTVNLVFTAPGDVVRTSLTNNKATTKSAMQLM